MKSRLFNIWIIPLLLFLVFMPAVSFADSFLPPPDNPLLEAVKKGDVKEVKSILKESGSGFSKEEINQKGHTGAPPLSVAVRSGRLEIVRLLVENGAIVDAGKETGDRTPLMVASGQGYDTVVRYLIAKGADVNKKDDEGNIGLMKAVESYNETNISSDYKGMEREGNLSKQKNEFIGIVETQEEWTELWKRAFEKPAPIIDFDKYAVACVFLGHSAKWFYSIEFGETFMRDNKMVIPYALIEVILRLAGPFKAGGQYHMKVFEKKKDVKMILEKAGQFPGK